MIGIMIRKSDRLTLTASFKDCQKKPAQVGRESGVFMS
jgi:hypothetical protein